MGHVILGETIVKHTSTVGSSPSVTILMGFSRIIRASVSGRIVVYSYGKSTKLVDLTVIIQYFDSLLCWVQLYVLIKVRSSLQGDVEFFIPLNCHVIY